MNNSDISFSPYVSPLTGDTVSSPSWSSISRPRSSTWCTIKTVAWLACANLLLLVTLLFLLPFLLSRFSTLISRAVITMKAASVPFAELYRLADCASETPTISKTYCEFLDSAIKLWI